MFGPAQVERDTDGWWQHPSLPSFYGDSEAFRSWLQNQGLELNQWSMESDGPEDHPYWLGAGGATHCLGWNPRSPGPEWFLLGIFDTENGPYVSWVRRVACSRHATASETTASCPNSKMPDDRLPSQQMHRYATGTIKHIFPWVSDNACSVRVLVDIEGEMLAAAQVQRTGASNSFSVATREEFKDMQQYYERNRGIYERPVELGLSACPEDDLPSWVIE